MFLLSWNIFLIIDNDTQKLEKLMYVPVLLLREICYIIFPS